MTGDLHFLAPAALILCTLCYFATNISADETNSITDNKEDDLRVYQSTGRREIKWPNRQLNVLVDFKSLNQSERLILGKLFDQIERKTCITIKRLPAESMNPFDPNDKDLIGQLDEGQRNFVYIFKSQFGAHNRHPSIGLSSLGCVRQGRQSLVLTELAFKWPELVLRYHLMRTLGVDNLERPDGEVHKLLNMLPLSQKISSDEFSSNSNSNNNNNQRQHETSASGGDVKLAASESLIPPQQQPFLTFASRAQDESPERMRLASKSRIVSQEAEVEYLHEDDVKKIKELYECPELQNRLSSGPILDETAPFSAADAPATTLSTLSDASGDLKQEAQTNLYSSDQEASTNLTPTTTTTIAPADSRIEDQKLLEAEESLREVIEAAEKDTNHQVDERLIDEAAKHIVDYLLADAGQLTPNSISTLAPEPTTTQTVSSDATPTTNELTSEGEPTSTLSTPQEVSPTTAPMPMGGSTLPPMQQNERQQRSTFSDETATPMSEAREKPMLLKLDDFHAQDPYLRQANEMKLSQLNANNLDSYGLANGADNANWQPQFYQNYQNNNNNMNNNNMNNQQQPQPQPQNPPGKSEMLISFEQRPDSMANPLASLASSQVLKLCSCTCQTMTPSTNPSPLPLPAGPNQQLVTPWPQVMPTSMPATQYPFDLRPVGPSGDTYQDYGANGNDWSRQPQQQQERETRTYAPIMTTTTTSSSETPASVPVTMQPDVGPSEQPLSLAPPSQWTSEETPTMTMEPADASPPNTTPTMMPQPATLPPSETLSTTTTPAAIGQQEVVTTQPPARTTTTTTTSASPKSQPMIAAGSYCELVQWVAPNKTVYASPRIVWDVDRANQNYFLCNALINGDLVPGKTHGFSCKISDQGKSYELHQFNVLTKPEHVNLAWVQRSSEAFGKTNFPVVGGYSKDSGEPLIVGRCLVRDENNDVVTLIGYVNNQGLGWFPFDDIQIECAQYDVLACVN